MHPIHKRSLIALTDDVIMMVLATVSAVMFIYEVFGHPSLASIVGMATADRIIAMIFLVEFLVRFTLTKSKREFMRTYWWEILAAIPYSADVFRVLRLVRLIRLSRVVIHLRSAYLHHRADVLEYRIT